jgi:hypothetical protein
MTRQTAHKNRDRTRRFYPRFERLEDRCCPSTVAIHGSTLLIHGGNSSSQIAITDDGQGNVSATVDGQTVSGSGVNHVVVNTGKGDDTITYTLTGQLTTSEHLQFQLGKGTSQLTLDFSKGTSGGDLAIGINGHGTDTVTSTFGDFNNTNLFFRANFGRGDDTVTTNLDGNILGTSQVRFNLHTGSGDDTVQFNAQGTSTDSTNPNAPMSGVQIDPSALLAINLNGGAGSDTATVTYEGVDNGGLKLNVNGGPGGDTVTANVTADSGSTGSIDAAVAGGPGNDNLTLNVYDNSGSSTSGGSGSSTLASLTAVLLPGPGNDTLTHTDNVTVQGPQS